MTNGQPLVIRAAKKPISTLRKPLDSINLDTKQPEAASYERSDVCAVPAASVIVENVVAFEIAAALVEKFGGDSLTEMQARYELFQKLAREQWCSGRRRRARLWVESKTRSRTGPSKVNKDVLLARNHAAKSLPHGLWAVGGCSHLRGAVGSRLVPLALVAGISSSRAGRRASPRRRARAGQFSTSRRHALRGRIDCRSPNRSATGPFPRLSGGEADGRKRSLDHLSQAELLDTSRLDLVGEIVESQHALPGRLRRIEGSTIVAAAQLTLGLTDGQGPQTLSNVRATDAQASDEPQGVLEFQLAGDEQMSKRPRRLA